MSPRDPSALLDSLTGLWAGLGAEGCLYAENLATGATLTLREAVHVPLASVAKLAIVAALFAEAEAGRVELRDRVTLDPAESTPGSTGISQMSDPVTMSLRDLAFQMVSVSDNAAANAIFERIGPEAVATTLADHGIRSIAVPHSMAHLYTALESFGPDGREGNVALQLAADGKLHLKDGLLPLADTNTGTARGIGALLRLVHRGELVSPEASSRIRALLRSQVFRHRIASGFPMDAMEYYGKTGTFLTDRHDAGVVVDRFGNAYVVVIFTHSHIAAYSQPEVDASMGYAARLAVDHLRER